MLSIQVLVFELLCDEMRFRYYNLPVTNETMAELISHSKLFSADGLSYLDLIPSFLAI